MKARKFKYRLYTSIGEFKVYREYSTMEVIEESYKDYMAGTVGMTLGIDMENGGGRDPYFWGIRWEGK